MLLEGIVSLKRQKKKENSHEGITWSEMGKQNVQAEKVYLRGKSVSFESFSFTRDLLGISPSRLRSEIDLKNFA